VSSSPAAVIRIAVDSAPSQDAEARSGDQLAVRAGDRPNGSKTITAPVRSRRRIVAASRSVLVEEATAGPSHSSSAGIASPADL
jgi:hypothetical protein